MFEILTKLNWPPLACQIICIVLCIIDGYLIGAINFGIILSRKMYNQDVRNLGSGNAGSTNMLRNYGWKASLLTLLGDILKTVVAIFIGMFLYGIIGEFLAGFFAMIGHSYPVFFKFKGGKGVACFAAIVITTSALMGKYHLIFVLGGLLLIFVGLVAMTKFISLGSIIVAMLYPVIMNRVNSYVVGIDPEMEVYQSVEIFAIAIALLIVFQHRQNIARLLRGEESKINFKKKKKVTEENAEK